MFISDLPYGIPFKFQDCDFVYKKILPFDDFPCVCCVEEINEEINEDIIQFHIYEDYEVIPVFAIQLSFF